MFLNENILKIAFKVTTGLPHTQNNFGYFEIFENLLNYPTGDSRCHKLFYCFRLTQDNFVFLCKKIRIKKNLRTEFY